MARNAIQFQDGLSLSEFLRRYGSEEQCEMSRLRAAASLKAGTIFAHSRVPLTTWFQAMWFITQSKGSISTLELSRQLDLKWDSEWLSPWPEYIGELLDT